MCNMTHIYLEKIVDFDIMIIMFDLADAILEELLEHPPNQSEVTCCAIFFALGYAEAQPD